MAKKTTSYFEIKEHLKLIKVLLEALYHKEKRKKDNKLNI